MENNNGIINNGGNIESKILTVGANATINATNYEGTSNNSNAEEILKILEQMVTKLNEITQPVNDKEDIISSMAILKQEVTKEKPNKITLRSIGKGVVDSLKYVTELAPYASSLWKFIVPLL
jgi:hypothetical protein